MFDVDMIPVKPSGTLIYAGVTEGNTFRFRDGVQVEIWHDRDYRVFIGGRFTTGWASEDQARTYAERF